jgi:hypothetical protein
VKDEKINKIFDFQDALNLDIFNLIKDFAEKSRFYPPQPKHIYKKGVILTKSGVLLREEDERHLVLLNEHRYSLLDSYANVFTALNENLNNELITTPIFIELSSLFSRKEKERAAAILMIQQLKAMGNATDLKKIIRDKSSVLEESDKDYTSKKFDSHVSTVLNTLPSNHPKARTRIFDMFMGDRDRYRMHLNFRLHARPIALGEVFVLQRPKSKKMRHQTFLIYSGLQVLDYIPKEIAPSGSQIIFDKFQRKYAEIRDVFRWLSENHL